MSNEINEKDKTHAFRPVLKEDLLNKHPIEPFKSDERGKIIGRTSQHLFNLSIRMDPDKTTENSSQIDAIPDVWARPIIFEMALYNPNHPLNADITGEWRGFLAMIALKETRRIPLTASRIDLSTNKNSSFIKVLNSLKTNNLLDPENTSNHIIYVFKYNNQPIAMSSANTFFSTGCEYKIDTQLISWVNKNKGCLIDPINSLRDEEKKGLTLWLYDIWTKLVENIGDSFTKKLGTNEYKTSDLFLFFMADLLCIENPKTQSNLADAVNSAIIRLKQTFVPKFTNDSRMNIDSNFQKAFEFHGFYQLFDNCLEPKKLSAKQSHVRIIPSNGKTPVKDLLLIDKYIATDWNRPLHDILVFDSLSLANIPDDLQELGNNRTVLMGKNLSDGVSNALWITKEDFFTEKVHLLEGLDGLPGSRGYENDMKGFNNLRINGKAITPLIPLKENILEYFTIDELTSRLEFSIRNEKLLVKLRLKLAYDETGNTFKDYTIEKLYETKQLEYVENIPVLQVWPNFIRQDYKSYYTYFNSARQTEDTFYAKPITFESKTNESTSYNNNNEFIKYKSTNSEQENIEDNTSNPNVDKMIRMEITRTEFYPDIMQCFVQQKMDNNSVTPKHIGFILLKKPSNYVNVNANQNCVIGIDFGTTSSNVYIREDNKPPTTVKFNRNLFSKITSTVADYERQTYEDFLPGKDEETPFLTIFKMVNTIRTDSNTIKPLFDGHIYFIEDFNKFSAGSSGIKTDIKWGTGKREYLKAFIRQIALQSAVEALSKGIGNVNFRFSYPTAFSKKHKTALDNAMRMALEELSKVSPAINSAHELEPEAMASTYFYAIPPQIKGYNIQKAAFTDGVVILDIGGGTSDISIIEGEKNEFKFKTSLKFAGREIFLKPLLQNVDFLKLFGVDEESINKIKELTGGADITSSAYTQADALIRSKSDSILNVLNNNYDKPEFVDFVQLIRIAIAGIFYYIGMIIKNLKDEGIYKSQRIPTVYVGGNGAKMFHWLAQGNYKNTDNALFQSTLMNEIFNPKLKYEPMRFDPETSEPNLKIYLTPTYMSKPEVAYGLVVDRNAKNVPVLNNTNLKDAFIAGEDFKIKTPASEDEKETISEKTYSDVVNRDDLKNMLTADGEISNDMFKKFLKVFDSCSEEVDIPKITPPQSKIEMMNSALRQDLNTLINKIKQDSTMADEIQDEHVIFINELRYFLDYKIEEWANTNY